jgi:ferredoxin
MVEGLEGSQLPNSRLCCQIKVTQDLDGMVVRVPRKEN